VKESLENGGSVGSAGVDGGGCGPGGVSVRDEEAAVGSGFISDAGLGDDGILVESRPARPGPVDARLWEGLSLDPRWMFGIVTGRLAKASKKGAGLSPSAAGVGVTDLIPTIITGTIRDGVPSPEPFAFSVLSEFVAGWLPKRNILKKFNDSIPFSDCPSAGAPPPRSLPPFLNAVASLPFCRARRKDSKLPSPRLSPATSCASVIACSAFPTKDAAVAAAATDKRRDSMAA
jgi:hypothetical protein